MIITNDFIFVHLQKTGGSFFKKTMRSLIHNKVSKKKDLLFGKYKIPYISPTFNGYNISGSTIYNKSTTHIPCRKIPKEHKHLPIVSSFRNPFDLYVSMYEYGGWKKPIFHKNTKGLDALSFNDFMYFIDDLFVKKIGKGENGYTFKEKIGYYSLRYIDFYTNDFYTHLKSIHEFDADKYHNIQFIFQETLRKDIFNLFLKNGYAEKDLALINSHPLVNTSKRRYSDWRKYYNTKLIDKVLKDDHMLFEKFSHYLESLNF